MLQFKAVVAGRLDTIYWVRAGRQVNAGTVIWSSMFIRLSCFRVQADLSLCLSVIYSNHAPIPHNLLTFLQTDQTQIRWLL